MFIAFIYLFLHLIIYVNFFVCVAKFWLLPELSLLLNLSSDNVLFSFTESGLTLVAFPFLF